jgi:hypothetical protein
MRIELVAAVISGVVAIGGAAIAFRAQTQVAAYQQDFDLLRLQLEQQHERQRPFLERQLQHYFEASAAASKAAILPDGADRSAAVQKFWQLYWGPLAVVEDSEVERAMFNFGTALRSESERAALQQFSLELAHACRGSREKQGGTDLGELKNLRDRNQPVSSSGDPPARRGPPSSVR